MSPPISSAAQADVPAESELFSFLLIFFLLFWALAQRQGDLSLAQQERMNVFYLLCNFGGWGCVSELVVMSTDHVVSHRPRCVL
jgi:hypothetical protein